MTRHVLPTVTVIYTGGTVARLTPFLDSLLEHTPWCYRLVVNGCGPNEVTRLRQRVDRLPERLELRSVSDHSVLPHGVVLDRLLHDETEPYFSILDSDVFAVAQPVPTALRPDDDAVGLCSCLPMWHRPTDEAMPVGYNVMGGRYLRSSDGTMLGCTYAATYRTAELRATLDRWAVSLRPYRWSELPPAVRGELASLGLRCDLYDTAKVANILIHADGLRLDHVDLPQLLHVGAQSGRGAPHSRLRALFRRTGFLDLRPVAAVRAALAGMTRAERESIFDLAQRRRRAVELVEGIAIGDLEVAYSCDWLDDEMRAQLIAVLASPEVGARS
jgi:hypothetical protein